MAMANAFSSSSFTVIRSKVSESSVTLSSFVMPSSKPIGTPRFYSSHKKNLPMCASVDGVDSVGSMSLKSEQENEYVPMPIVLIDQDTDPDATIVQVSFGDRLGALIDTMKALRDLGLDVSKGTVTTENSVTQTKFFITRRSTGRRVDDPDLLERIRLTIINNLLKYHPESSERLAMGEAFGVKPPETKVDVDIATHIHIKEDGPRRSLLYVETADRPGLLMEMVKIMLDININVESAEIDTEGLVAKDKFHVSYRGAALNSSLSQKSPVGRLLGRREVDNNIFQIMVILDFIIVYQLIPRFCILGQESRNGWRSRMPQPRVCLGIGYSIKTLFISPFVQAIQSLLAFLAVLRPLSLAYAPRKIPPFVYSSIHSPLLLPIPICCKASASQDQNFCPFSSAARSRPVTVDDFVFSGIKSLTGSSETGFSSIPVSASIFPGLSTLRVSFVRSDLCAVGINVPHYHPRATEVAFVLEGRIYSGFVDSWNRVFAKVLEKGEVMVFPKGLLHFQLNVGVSRATVLGSFKSQNPDIKEEISEKAFGLSSKES
ncbi:act domain-containing protein acr12 [Phtheirospermum japonicum]|uniref:Act domain-containing protein acr12 n=1 Tax=Phtheirospermum japonicum TaxID=374723 RepID=A0A830CQH5_9LAMI|nr:act domain-containing protein acr12 [Phtheirospermum japonicum]